jgi:hypothetical protein
LHAKGCTRMYRFCLFNGSKGLCTLASLSLSPFSPPPPSSLAAIRVKVRWRVRTGVASNPAGLDGGRIIACFSRKTNVSQGRVDIVNQASCVI